MYPWSFFFLSYAFFTAPLFKVLIRVLEKMWVYSDRLVYPLSVSAFVRVFEVLYSYVYILFGRALPEIPSSRPLPRSYKY